jgi:prepilin signal peptidase PulO-like enzyme (type II secretory pathway)
MLLPVSFFLSGLIFGSFGSVLITRVPNGEKITGRSRCPQCKTTLSAIGLIPLVSFCLSRGKCRTCNKPIGMFYPLIELASGAIFLLAFCLNRDIASSVFMAMALWLLFIISVIDIRTQTISDMLNIPLSIFGIFYSLEIGAFYWGGALVGAGFFGGLWILSKGKWIGSGDIILGAGIGFLVGSWQMMIMCMMMTYIIGAVVAIALVIMGKLHRKSTLPFAQFFSFGALFAVVFRDRLELLISMYF